MSNDDIKPGEQLTLAQINRLRKKAQDQAKAGNGAGQASGIGSPDETDPMKMKVDDLKDWLTERGVEFDAGAKKADLQALIPQSKQAGGEPDETETENEE